MKIALTIAGSDPTGGAGLQADLKVFHSMDVHGLSVTSALTAQNTGAVDAIYPVESEQIRAQLDSLLMDIKPDALKTGMLYSTRAVEITAEAVKKHKLTNLVIDPVTVSSSGKSLVADGTIDIMKKVLFPLAKVITPNIYEASVLTGLMVETPSDMEEAAKKLFYGGPDVVIITGGHLEGQAMDILFDGDKFLKFSTPRLEGEFHGTGCTFSAAITALLALGASVESAVQRAKELITDSITRSYKLGKGMRILRS
jgi:hydroxymethylpyrimidine/phosphomethylpyrimidine kinase